MKNTIKLLGIFALAALICFSIAGCKKDEGGGLNGGWTGDKSGDKDVSIEIDGEDITVSYDSKDYTGKVGEEQDLSAGGATSKKWEVTGTGSTGVNGFLFYAEAGGVEAYSYSLSLGEGSSAIIVNGQMK